MIDRSVLRKGWEMLDARERRVAVLVLVVVVLSALSSALMVGSVLPFLTVLADPGRIATTPALAWAFEAGGFAEPYDFLVALGLGSLGVIAAASAVQILRAFVVTRFALMQVHRLSHRLLAVYLGQPYEFFLDRHSGDLGTKILSESGEVVNRFYRPAADAVAAAFTIAALVGLLLWVDPVVALVAFAVLGASYALIYSLSRRALARLGQRRAEVNRERYRLAGEALGGVKDIKLLGHEARYVDRYARPSAELARSQTLVTVWSEVPIHGLYALAFGGMIVLCLALMDRAALQAGAALGGILPLLGVFAFAGQRLMPELSRLYISLTSLQYGAAAVDTVHADLIGRAGPPPAADAGAISLSEGIRFEGIGYRYPGGETAGLDGITLDIRAGERIGVVGSSGAGKSTLADVLLGLLRPTEGRLVVDGVPITQANVRAWQRRVGYVPQDIFLTDATVAENIALGLAPGEIDRERLCAAARTAQLDRFIEEVLPQGYDTMVGERGVRLSGGQKQRIGIARALYHDADLIVFDEATSALDNLTEQDVMAAIGALPGDKTIVVIAHRMTTVRGCDRILVMRGGRRVDFAPWADLAAGSEEFRKLAGEREAA
jgi:ATP-binding cassette, subfamily B, bacterial PglK